jgi:hypothetical protein
MKTRACGSRSRQRNSSSPSPSPAEGSLRALTTAPCPFLRRGLCADTMAFNRITDEQHDDADGDDFLPIGEVKSEEDGQLASVTLFEVGIPCELAHGASDVDEIRRFVEGWAAGQMLLVRPQDAARAIAAVQSSLAPTQFWSDTKLYLEQCPTESLLKLLDFPDLLSKPVLGAATRVLAGRGIAYPPDGVSSMVLPITCLLLGVWLGPFAGIAMRWRIEKTNPMKNGGSRPHYDTGTRRKANQCLLMGFVIWCTFVVFAIAYRALDTTGAFK